MKKVLERIKSRRQQMKISQAEIAQKLGMTQAGYQWMEKGNLVAIDKERIKQIALILDTTVEWLMGADDTILERYSVEVQRWLLDPKSKEYVVKAYTDYIKQAQ